MNESTNLRLKSTAGLSILEVMISVAIVGVVISLTFVPMVQFKKTERMADFQASIDLQHQIAIQKARNITYLKKILQIDPNVNLSLEPQMPPYDQAKLKCFQQAGTGCASYSATNKAAEPPEVFKSGSLAGTSTITYSVNCTSTTCTDISVSVETKEGGGKATSGTQNTQVAVRSRFFKSVINANSLASRSDINFASCSLYFLTGIGFKDLKSQCEGFAGATSCNGTSDRPMMLFGQTGAEVCQVTTTKVCNNYGYSTGGAFDSDPNCSSGGVAPPTIPPTPIPPTSPAPTSPTPTTPVVVPGPLVAPVLTCTTTGGASGVSIDVKTGDTLNCTFSADAGSTDWEGCGGSTVGYCDALNASAWDPSSVIASGANIYNNWKPTSKTSATFSYKYTGMNADHAKYWGATSAYRYWSARSFRISASGPTEYSPVSNQVGIKFIDPASAAPDFHCKVTDAAGKVTDSRDGGILTAKLGSKTECSVALTAPSTKWSGCYSSGPDSSACSWIPDSTLMTPAGGFPAWTGSSPNYAYSFSFTDCAKNPHGNSLNYWFAKGVSDAGLESTISNSVRIQYMCDDSPPVMTCTAKTPDGKVTNSTPTSFDVPFGATWSCTLKFASGGRTAADGKWVFWGEAANPPKSVDLTGAALRHTADFKTGWAYDSDGGMWKPSASDDSLWIRAPEVNDGSPHPLGLLPGPATACFQIGDLINQKTSQIICFNVGGPDYSAVWCPVSGPSAPISVPTVSSGQATAQCGTCNVLTGQCLPGASMPQKVFNPGEQYTFPDGTIVSCKADTTAKAAPPSNSLACDSLVYNAWCAVDPITGLGTGFTSVAPGAYNKPGCYMDASISATGTVSFHSTDAKVVGKNNNLYVCMSGTATTGPDLKACKDVSFLPVYNNWCEVDPSTGLGVKLTNQPTGVLDKPGCKLQASLDPSGVETRYDKDALVKGTNGKLYACLAGTTTTDVSINSCKDVRFSKAKCPDQQFPNWNITCSSSGGNYCTNHPLMSALNAAYQPTAGVYGVTVYDNNYPNTPYSSTGGNLMTCDESKLGTSALFKMQSCGSNNLCGGVSVGYQCSCGDGSGPTTNTQTGCTLPAGWIGIKRPPGDGYDCKEGYSLALGLPNGVWCVKNGSVIGDPNVIIAATLTKGTVVWGTGTSPMSTKYSTSVPADITIPEGQSKSIDIYEKSVDCGGASIYRGAVLTCSNGSITAVDDSESINEGSCR